MKRSSRQRRIDAAPVPTGDVTQDAWLGAVGEHLALRWGLVVPTWTEREQHFCLQAPVFVPPSQALQALLYFESPLPFDDDKSSRSRTHYGGRASRASSASADQSLD